MNDPEKQLPEQFFVRQDSSHDQLFYREPRMVTHIDDATIAALTAYYSEVLPGDSDILDLMSSWISHLPEATRYRSVTGLGMNAVELNANSRLDQQVVHDLNQSPQLPFADHQFDATLIAVSVQYLVQPLTVFAEIHRVLKPGGRCIVAMSHRLFPTKAIYAFHVLPPADRMQLVASYLNYGGFTAIEALDRSPPEADPLWLVTGVKQDQGGNTR